MKTLRLSALLGAALLVGATSTAFAQNDETPAPAKTERAQVKTHLIKIKNLPSAIVAYTLDPKHNPRPLGLGENNVVWFAEKPDTEEKGTFELPGDITQIVSIDPQNVILVAGGSDQDIRRLMELIDVLDQPLRQVEIEAQIIQITPEDAREFGITPAEKRNGAAQDATQMVVPLTPQLGFVRNNFTAKLNKLIADDKVKVLAAPRVTTINNLSATLRANTGSAPSTDPKRPFASREMGADLKLTPTINGDDTITLLIDAAALLEAKSNVTSIINLRDGDTFALAGLSSLFAPADAVDPPNIVVFVTARIIRRVADDVNIVTPGK